MIMRLIFFFIIGFILWLCLFSGFGYAKKVELITNMLNAILGAIVTIVGVFITLDNSNKQFTDTIQENRNNYKEDTRLKLMPHLKIHFYYDDKNFLYNPIYFNATKERIQESSIRSNLIERKIKISNIGLGTAVDINIQIENYEGKYPDEHVETRYLFDLAANEDIYVKFVIFELGEGTYNISLNYKDIICCNDYEQKGRIYIQRKCIENIIFDSVKKI